MQKKERFPTRASMIRWFLVGSKRWFISSILFAVLVSLADSLEPKIMEYTIDAVIGESQKTYPAWVRALVRAGGGTAYLRTHLVRIALVVLAVALAGALARYLFKALEARGAEALVRRIRDELFSHILRLPVSWHNAHHTGDIIQRCTSDVETVKVFISEQLTSLFRVLLMIILAMYFMVRTNLFLACIAGVFVPVIVISSVLFYREIGSSFEQVDEEEGRLSSIVQENLTGVRVVRAFGRESYERVRFEKKNDFYTRCWHRLIRIMTCFWVSGNVVATIRAMLLTVIGAVLCVRGSMTAGEFIAFISYNTMLALPVRRLGRIISDMGKAGISIDRIRYIMNAEEERESQGALCPDLTGDICFDHVSYRYEDGSQEVLSDVSFSVRAGQTVGILGGTGSGKTTLMYLLDRLYDLPADRGRITIGGQDIQQISRAHLRSRIGMVMQEPFLFSRTLFDNIRMARREAGIKKIRQAARAASLDDAIRAFSDGYETYVGERGVTLSGGQKQRTAIAQMLVREPDIMIFDDSLSAVDAETDARIREALQGGRDGATKFLIAHRITTLMQADLILVMEGGRIVQRGRHEDLVREEGIYRRIYELQTEKEA